MSMNKNMPSWETLKCKCKSEIFVKIIGLQWHSNGGTTETPKGYKCESCSKVVTMGEMIQRSKLEMKQKELESLEAEILDA